MTYFQINTGADATAIRAETLSGDALGARYDSFRNFGRFETQTEDLNTGLIVWPGGSLAEVREDRYGLEYDGLYADWTNKPDIEELMAEAIEKGASLSIIIPTVRYLGREEDLESELDGFLEDLLGGSYGALPEQLILEVGSEYYAHFEDLATSAASQYGVLANTIVARIVSALEDPTVNLVGGDLTIAVQAGKTIEDDADIRAELSPAVLADVDMVIHHRFSPQAQGFDARIDDLEVIVQNWHSESLAVGGETPDLFVSAWNVASFTRANALSEYLSDNPALSAADIDLDGRTSSDFEEYWQMRLGQHDYGEKHPAAILEAFASYAEAGMSAGAVFGTDYVHPGRLSWREDGSDHWFVGHDMIEMIYEAVDGTKALASESEYDRNDEVRTYAFEGADRLVVFVAADDMPPDAVELGVEGISEDFVSLWVDTLVAVEDEDWMSIFGIPDNPDVDETHEAGTFATGLRGSKAVGYADGNLQLSIDPHEVIRLVFAKTEEAADALAGLSDNPEMDLAELISNQEAMPFPPIEPWGGVADPPVAVEDPDQEHSGGDGGGFGFEALLLLPLLLFF